MVARETAALNEGTGATVEGLVAAVNADDRRRTLEAECTRIEQWRAALASSAHEQRYTPSEAGTGSLAESPLSNVRDAARKRRHKFMFSSLPKYDGSANVSKLLEFIDLHGTYLVATNKVTNEEVRKHLPFYLTNMAGQWWRHLEQKGELSDDLSHIEIFEKMKSEFHSQEQKDDAHARLQKLDFSGCTTSYHASFWRLAEDAGIAGSKPIPTSDILKMFLDWYARGGATGILIRNSLITIKALDTDTSIDALMAVADNIAQMLGPTNTRRRRDSEDERGTSNKRKRGR
ncbi:hypothetical protein HDU86_005593 [Geranomyces michiganensis]|nr:hypothetical protein HDU86_005593 [Geranomyces michiganensis]